MSSFRRRASFFIGITGSLSGLLSSKFGQQVGETLLSGLVEEVLVVELSGLVSLDRVMVDVGLTSIGIPLPVRCGVMETTGLVSEIVKNGKKLKKPTRTVHVIFWGNIIAHFVFRQSQ